MAEYRVEFHAKASAETIGLPPAVFRALVEVLRVVAEDPHDPAVTRATFDPRIRDALFARWGLVTFWVDDQDRVVRVHGVTWAG